MGDANVVNLQRALNRFAASVGFTPIAADGVVGTQTLITTKRVLTYIAVDLTETGEPFSQQASYFDAKTTTSTTVLAVSSAQLAAFLNQVATAWALPVTGPGMIIPGAGGGTVIGTKPGLATSLVGGWYKLAAWQKVGAVLLAIIAALWGAKQWKARKGGV